VLANMRRECGANTGYENVDQVAPICESKVAGERGLRRNTKSKALTQRTQRKEEKTGEGRGLAARVIANRDPPHDFIQVFLPPLFSVFSVLKLFRRVKAFPAVPARPPNFRNVFRYTSRARRCSTRRP
jgi:hypothetical protein